MVRAAGDGYFRLMRTALVDGRGSSRGDPESRPIVVSVSLARQLFGDVHVSGRRVFVGRTQQVPSVIVGVIEDVKQRALDEGDVPTVYQAAASSPSPPVTSSSGTVSAADILSVVRAEVARLDADLPVYGATTMAEVVGLSPGVPARRLVAQIFAGFAVWHWCSPRSGSSA